MILGHCHLFPGGLGEAKRDAYGIPGTSEHLHGFMRAFGFQQAQVIGPYENPADPAVKARGRPGTDSLTWLLEQPHVGVDGSSALLPAATITPHEPDAAERLLRAQALGVRMLKVHPIIMRTDPLSPECRAFFEEAQKGRMPIVCHTGGGKWGWTDQHSRPQVCAELARRYPDLPILMAHCGVFAGVDEFNAAVAACPAHPNLYLDATAALLPVGLDRWKRALDLLGAERVIYGNDYPWISREGFEQELLFIDSLGLSTEGKDLILGGNLTGLWQRAGSE